MERFDHKGMLIIPNPLQELVTANREVAVIREGYCPNGHQLINPRANFNGYPGILLKVQKDDKSGLIAVSPIYGDKTRFSLDIDLMARELVKLSCPVCGTVLPIHSTCTCGGDIVAVFLTSGADFSNCIGLCNRIDCHNAKFIEAGKLIRMNLEEVS